MWFLSNLSEDLGLQPTLNYTFISDGQKAKVVSSSREGGIRDTDGMHKKKGTNKAVKSTQGFRFSKPKTNLIYRHVSKPITTKEHADKPNAKVSSSKEGANGADKESSISSLVTMNDSSGSKNDIAYIQDDINLVQLRRNMDRLMDEDSVLELNSNNEKVSVIDTNSVPNANVVVSNNKSAPAEVKESDKGSLLEQFKKAREASTSKHISSMLDSDESEVEEVCMPDVIPGGGFLNGLGDDLERYDGYEARLYDLSEQEQAFCDLNIVTNNKGLLFENDKVPDAFVSHYEVFLGQPGNVTDLNMGGLFFHKLDKHVAVDMTRMVSDIEIKNVMFSMGNKKSPWPDGFTAAFFKDAWDIVRNDVILAVREFFINGKLLKELNHTIIALIPKVAAPTRVNDFCHISCCNVLFKCISKIIANRIKSSLKGLISPNQSAFVPGRSISDNILLTQELMHNYHLNPGSPRCAFKVDIQKAIDTVD
ncbi:putative RNA-directed DNA polymerase, eukaryota, reverse transcriptase zinc-binding domain protein [Tanacetum coccineum]